MLSLHCTKKRRQYAQYFCVMTLRRKREQHQYFFCICWNEPLIQFGVWTSFLSFQTIWRPHWWCDLEEAYFEIDAICRCDWIDQYNRYRTEYVQYVSDSLMSRFLIVYSITNVDKRKKWESILKSDSVFSVLIVL